MQRRKVVGFGIMLVATVLLLVFVSHDGIGGKAMVLPVPGQPTPGACVTELGATDSEPAFTSDGFDTQECQADESRYGEVVAVEVRQGATSTDGSQCLHAARMYVGLTSLNEFIDQYNNFQSWYWQSLVDIQGWTFLPSRRQLEAGQHWVGCAAILGSSSGVPQKLTKSIKLAMAESAPDRQFAVCADSSSNMGLEIVDCTVPHSSEIFGVVNNWTGPRQDITASCIALASHLTGRSKSELLQANIEVAVTWTAAGASNVNEQPICSATGVKGVELVGPLTGLAASQLLPVHTK